jgi:hypothetical protein
MVLREFGAAREAPHFLLEASGPLPAHDELVRRTLHG